MTSYDPDRQGPIATMLDLSGSAAQGNLLNLTFDYSAGAGTLYFHLRGSDDPGGQNWDLNLNSGFGHMYDDDAANPDVGVRYDLTDGQTVHTGTTDDHGESRGFRDHTVGLTGSGTFNVTYDLSSYAVSDISDYKWLALGFAINGAGTDTVTVSNLSLTAVPEPSSVALVGVALAGLVLRRRTKPKAS